MWDEDGNMAAALVQMSCRYRGMLAVRATGIRTLLPGLVPVQFRVFSVRKDPDLEENPFYLKYQDKIRHLRSSKPQEFKARLESRHQSKQEVLGRSKQAEFVKLMEQEMEQRDRKSADGQSAVFRKNKTLDSILNLDMIQDKSGEDISQLWMKYFSTQDTISAVIPTQTYETIHNRAKTCPMFLYALPQMDGYEFLVGQWSGHQLHFTSLINIQTLGENAPSQLILYHYPELKDRGLVLMTAERDNSFITLHQAQCLANQVQLFYGSQRQETFRLVETFNHTPADFKHMMVIAELEQSGLGPGLNQNQDKPGKSHKPES